MKNKYKLLFVFALVGFLFTTSVSAKEVTLKTLDTEISENYAEAKDKIGFLYVIGDYAFSSEHTLTLQDVVYASNNSKNNIAEDLTSITVYYLQRTSNESDEWTGWIEGKPVIGTGTLVNSEKFNISYIDYKDIEDRTEINSDTNFKNYVKGLIGGNYFDKEYDETSGTLTINLKNISSASGTNAMKGIVDLLAIEGYESADISYSDISVNITKDEKDTGAIKTKLDKIINELKSGNNITNAKITINLNLGEAFEEVGTHSSGIHKAVYSVKFTSIVDVDSRLAEMASGIPGGKKLSMTVDGTTIIVTIDSGAGDSDTLNALSGTNILSSLLGLVADPRVKQINVGNVVISGNSSSNQVKIDIANALGGVDTKLKDLLGKSLTVKIELNDGMGVLDSKTGKAGETSRTYTIKFVGESAENTKTSIETAVIGNLCSGCDKTLDTKSNKNIYVVNITKDKFTSTVTSSTLFSATNYKSIDVTIDGKTYSIKGEGDDDKESLKAVLDKKLSELLGKDITVKYNLKDNEVDSSEDVVKGDGYTEYVLQIRYVVDTNDVVGKAVNNLTYAESLKIDTYGDAAINMSFDKDKKTITFELVHPNVGINTIANKVAETFNSELTDLLKNGYYESIVVTFNGTAYEIKLNEETLSDGLSTLLNSIASKTLNEIKDAKITVTFNLNNGVMDKTYGDVENIEYTINLSNKISVKDVIKEALKDLDYAHTTAKVVFNEEEKVFYLLYNNGVKTIGELETTALATNVFGDDKGLIKLIKDERVKDITITIGNEQIVINNTSKWNPSIKDVFEFAIEKLVKDKIDSYSAATAVKFDQLQSVVKTDNLLKIKVTLKYNYAVTEENNETAYEYGVKMSQCLGTVARMNSIKIGGKTPTFSDSEKEINVKVEDSMVVEFKSTSGVSDLNKAITNGLFSSVVVSGRKSGTTDSHTLLTLTKENAGSTGNYDDSDGKLLNAIKDLIGIEKDAKNLTDLIGYDIVFTVNLRNDLRSENGNKTETYTIHFVENA